MTNKHDGPRAGTPVTVLQSAEPTRLTQAEAEELYALTEAALKARSDYTYAMVESGIRSQECQDAEAVDSKAYRALYRWQRAHGLEEK